MKDLLLHKQAGQEIEQRLRLKSFPLAIRLLRHEGEIPDNAKRPVRDFGYHLSLCQGYQTARREGTTVAMLKEDMWCFEPVVGYGLGAPPAYFLEGYNRFPKDVESLAAGRNYAETLPRFELGRFVGVVAAPLATAMFEPDLAMIYCDSTQLNLLLLAREYRDGLDLKCTLSSHAACVYSVVPVIQSGRCQVSVPCRGDHYTAMAGDDEMIFSVPTNGLADILAGLRHVERTGSRLPRGYKMYPEYPLPESYDKIARMMGYI